MAELSKEQVEFQVRMESVFMPHSRRRRDTLVNEHGDYVGKFVHYTSAEAAINILNTKRVWMRNAMSMVDYSEVLHGFNVIDKLLKDAANWSKFNSAVDNCFDGLTKQTIDLFNSWWEHIRTNTYITSISEHRPSEDQHGRLSMWRAFGGSGGRVAVVLNIPRYSGAAASMNVMLSPVGYMTEADAQAEFSEVIENINRERDMLQATGQQSVLAYLFQMLLSAVTSMKHPGFHEEREWRAIYLPTMAPSPLMQRAVETIGGVPQIVYKLPLDETVGPALAELDVKRLLDRVIIGPTQYAVSMSQAFVQVLDKVGVTDPSSKVVISGIPVRT
jgi:hypothetical protein